MKLMKFGCSVIECNCTCGRCGTEQTYKAHIGCCPDRELQSSYQNICCRCGAKLSVGDITEKCALYELLEKGAPDPSGPNLVEDEQSGLRMD